MISTLSFSKQKDEGLIMLNQNVFANRGLRKDTYLKVLVSNKKVNNEWIKSFESGLCNVSCQKYAEYGREWLLLIIIVTPFHWYPFLQVSKNSDNHIKFAADPCLLLLSDGLIDMHVIDWIYYPLCKLIIIIAYCLNIRVPWIFTRQCTLHTIRFH